MKKEYFKFKEKNKNILLIIILLIIVLFLIYLKNNQDQMLVNYLKNKNYKNEEIEIIFKHLNKKEVFKIALKPEKIDHISDYITDDYFFFNHLDRYLIYKNKKNNLNYQDIISYVNMSLDEDFYKKIITITNPEKISLLVNKYYRLDENYIPNNLEEITLKCAIKRDLLVKEEVKKDFEEMCFDMKAINLMIKAISTYRSYQAQQALYDYYIDKKGPKMTDTYLAKPGHSEHQTGLAIDVYNGITSYLNFNYTDEYRWIFNNAHQYGFIIRYPKEKEHITGYGYEPWHLRYVGKKIATYLYHHNLTLDEYDAQKLYQRK